MKYTIITACLNSINTISKTVESIFVQKYLPFQYIFIDGGSDDGTLEYLSKITKKFENQGVNCITIDQDTRGGIYEAWNMGLSRVSSESDFIFILNSDDWYLDNTTELVSKFFYNNPYVDIFNGHTLNYYNNGKKIIARNRNLKLFPLLMPLNHPACFIRKEVYNRVGNFNDIYRVSADYDFLFRCYNSNIKFGFTNNILVKRLMGGFADSNKELARKETLNIGVKNSKTSFFPKLAYLIRKLFKK